MHVPRTVWHYISCWAPSGWGEQHFQATVIHSQCCSPAGESGGLFCSAEHCRTRTSLRGRSCGVRQYSTCCLRGVLPVPDIHPAHYIPCWAPPGWGEQHFQATVMFSQCCSPAGESGGLFRSVELNRTRTPLRGRSRGVGHYSTCCSRGVLHVPNTH